VEKPEKAIMMDLTLFDVETSINFQLMLPVYERPLFSMQKQLIISPSLPLFSLYRYIAAFNNSSTVTHCDAVRLPAERATRDYKITLDIFRLQ
jgi:hypothetical protein